MIGPVGTFIDDIFGGGRSREGMLERMEQTFSVLEKAGFTLRKDKCEMFLTKIEVLGHIISGEGITKDERKVEAIRKVETPQNVKQVQSFCGMVNYYAKFLPRLADLLHPLHCLLKKGVPFTWTKECESAFEKIKEEMTKDITLAHYDPADPLTLVTDASDHAIASVLMTNQKGVERPIAYWARSLLSSERNYSVIDKEALAIVNSCKHFSKYLLGRKFNLKTDQKPLLRIFGDKDGIPQTASARLIRWAVYMSGFDYEISHVGQIKTWRIRYRD